MEIAKYSELLYSYKVETVRDANNFMRDFMVIDPESFKELKPSQIDLLIKRFCQSYRTIVESEKKDQSKKKKLIEIENEYNQIIEHFDENKMFVQHAIKFTRKLRQLCLNDFLNEILSTDDKKDSNADVNITDRDLASSGDESEEESMQNVRKTKLDIDLNQNQEGLLL